MKLIMVLVMKMNRIEMVSGKIGCLLMEKVVLGFCGLMKVISLFKIVNVMVMVLKLKMVSEKVSKLSFCSINRSL